MTDQIPSHAEVPVAQLVITSADRRQHGDMKAFDQAAKRARMEYLALMPSWPLSDEAEFHLTLVVKYRRK